MRKLCKKVMALMTLKGGLNEMMRDFNIELFKKYFSIEKVV
jgi:hypothetical protein